MKKYLNAILRWSVILGAGGYGLWQLYLGARSVVSRWNGNWLDAAIQFVFSAVIAAPLLAVAYLCFRRRYRKLLLVLGAVGAVVLFGLLMTLPTHFGIEKYIEDPLHANGPAGRGLLPAFVGLPILLIFFFGPVYAAAWFFRFFRYLSLPGSERTKMRGRPKTQATRWLVWAGLVCMLAPMAQMLVDFTRALAAPGPPVPPQQLADSMGWSIGIVSIGFLLIFLGLVRRRPVAKPAAPAEEVRRA